MIEYWKTLCIEDIDHIVKYAKYPKRYKYSKFSRIMGWISCAIFCTPCRCWSIIGRICACPYKCIKKAHICDGNCCTKASDDTISTYIEEQNKIIKANDILKTINLMDVDRTIIMDVLHHGIHALHETKHNIISQYLISDILIQIMVCLGFKDAKYQVIPTLSAYIINKMT